MKILSLFSGIGAFEKALTNLNINYELVNFCEIDKYAIKSYCAIHNVSESLNLGDITKIDISKMPTDIDLLTHGSPCQDFSNAGLQAGGDKGTNTRSSLMWYSVEIIRHIKPKYVIWENVKNVLSAKHKHNFDKYLEELSNIGYTNYYQVLNAKDYGIPQHRERLFCVSILNDTGNIFKFPKKEELKINVNDILEKNVDKKYFLSEKMIKCMTTKTEQRATNTFIGMYQFSKSDSFMNGKDRLKINKNISDTLQTTQKEAVVLNNCVRKLTPLECFRLMGFNDEDYFKTKNIGISDTQLYKQTGNSIVVKVIEKIFKNLLIS